MSHYIIINGVKYKGPHGDDLVASEPSEVLSYEVKYTPSHDMTPDQVGDVVTKILKLTKKIEDAAAGEAEQ